jgi:adenylate cyclase
MPPKVLPVMFTWLYRKLGRFYPAVFLTAELQTAFGVTLGTLALLSFYWDVSTNQFLKLVAISMTLTAVAVFLNLWRTYPLLRPVRDWIAGARSPEQSAAAWSAAVGLPANLIRRDMFLPFTIVVFPSCIAALLVFDLPWLAFFPIFAASSVAVGYGAILHYLALELGMRPVLIDINQSVTPRLHADFTAIPLRVRLMTALPLINLITGLVVAALTSSGGGGASLGADVLIAVAVATTISLELTILLSKSILRPISDLREATQAVRQGDFGVSVPVTTGDELGDLAASFNQMVTGLAERERIREAFGTYLDHEVADYILSEGFSEEGVQRDVSVLFCDVRDFTRFARQADAKQVVAALNELFEVIVPIVSDHGGHVDKFVGDGLLAVFGAPEPHPDHADRALRAACEMSRRVNGGGVSSQLRIGVGVNSGQVVAGSIGGAGRLNFSVIGDAVNVAARVEAATRQLDDDVLITAETRRRVQGEFELTSRGRQRLKGIEEAIELYAPATSGTLPPMPADVAATAESAK